MVYECIHRETADGFKVVDHFLKTVRGHKCHSSTNQVQALPDLDTRPDTRFGMK